MRPVTTAAALAAAFFLSACASLFGPAETTGQKAFRKAGEYVYVALAGAEYARHPGAQEGTLAALAALDESAYAALQAARLSYQAGADDVTADLLALASALASFNLEVLGSGALPDDAFEAVDRTIVMVAVGVRAAARMRLWRKGYLQPKLEAMAAQGREPTPQEWTELLGRVERVHRVIREAAGQGPADPGPDASRGEPDTQAGTGVAPGGRR